VAQQVTAILTGGESMAEEISVQKSLVEQILDEMFASIGEQDIFDAQTIQRLKLLATTNELKKPTKVAIAIKSASDGKP
jgi:hypothetical protein